MNHALFHSSTKTFFAAESGAYRYWLTPARGLAHTVIRLQAKRAVLQRFLRSVQAQSVQHYVEILEHGCGWFEITPLRSMWGLGAIHLDGARIWLRAWNAFHLATVNANTLPFKTERRRSWAREPLPEQPVESTPLQQAARDWDQHVLQRLSDHFSSVHRPERLRG